MKTTKYLLPILTVAILTVAGCQKFGELEKDPNKPTAVTPGLALNGVLNDFYRRPWDLNARWSQFHCCNYNYYGNQEYNWGPTGLNYTTLKNVIKMEQEAARVGLPDNNPYRAIGKFLRAFFFYEMTMKVGDLPMTEALQSLTNLTPKYDTQKEIFKQILQLLKESNNDIAELVTKADNSLSGDFYYNNDLKKWQKAVNAFTLRVLIALSKKETDAELQVKQKFGQIINNPTQYPLFTDNSDNLKYVYNSQFNKYPVNPDNYGFDALRYNMSATHLNKLAELKDPRAYLVAEPSTKKVSGGMLPTDFNAFVGASSAEDLADMTTKAQNGEYSLYNRKRFYTSYTAEDCIQIGYPEMCFNIAEAVNRGWITGNAEDWYKKGIQSSHLFYGIETGNLTVYFFKTGGNPLNPGDYNTYTVAFDWNTYYAQPPVQYSGNNATGLNQILTQKYLAFFQNSGWEAFFNYRRTGVPQFSAGGPGTGNSGLIPKRFQYPGSERTTNNQNLTEALERQFGGDDDINAAMWVIQ